MRGTAAFLISQRGPSGLAQDEKGMSRIHTPGGSWFVAADVCRALGLGSPTMACRPLGNDEKRLNRIEGMRGSPATLISESGLYGPVLSEP